WRVGRNGNRQRRRDGLASLTRSRRLIVRRLAHVVLPLIVAVVWPAVSCQRGGVSGTVPVSGKVTYKGQPVAQATVTFIGEGEARTAVAITDARGVYQLKTLDSVG